MLCCIYQGFLHTIRIYFSIRNTALFLKVHLEFSYRYLLGTEMKLRKGSAIIIVLQTLKGLPARLAQ